MKTKAKIIKSNNEQYPYNVQLSYSEDGKNFYYSGVGRFFKTHNEAIEYAKSETI